MTPVWYAVPPRNRKVPTPGITTWIRVGAQPVVSLYRTLKRMVVDGDPEPGDALPLVSVGVACEEPLQLAASADPVQLGMRIKPAAATIAMTKARDALRLTGGLPKHRVGAPRIPIWNLKVEAGFAGVVGHIDASDQYLRPTTRWSCRLVQLGRRGMYWETR